MIYLIVCILAAIFIMSKKFFFFLLGIGFVIFLARAYKAYHKNQKYYNTILNLLNSPANFLNLKKADINTINPFDVIITDRFKDYVSLSDFDYREFNPSTIKEDAVFIMPKKLISDLLHYKYCFRFTFFSEILRCYINEYIQRQSKENNSFKVTHNDGFVWKVARNFVLKRDDQKCVLCGASDDLHVHHIALRAEGGNHDPANLICVCKKCHFLIPKHGKVFENLKDDEKDRIIKEQKPKVLQYIRKASPQILRQACKNVITDNPLKSRLNEFYFNPDTINEEKIINYMS